MMQRLSSKPFTAQPQNCQHAGSSRGDSSRERSMLVMLGCTGV
jgi:hypothetical protein